MASFALGWLSDAWDSLALADAAFDLRVESRQRVDFSLTLSPGPLILVLSFLDAKSLARASGICREIRGILRRNPRLHRHLWRRHAFNLVRRFVQDPISPGVELNLQEQYVAMSLSLARGERGTLTAVAATARAVEHYRSSVVGRLRGDVIGLTSEIAWVNDPLLSLAISMRRKAAMHSVIVKNNAACSNLKRSLSTPQPISVIPRDSIMEFYSHDRFVPPSIEEGCLGYADELIRLRPEHEMYRVCFRAVFKDLLVWNKRSDAEAYANRLGIFAEDMSSICCLDHPALQGKELNDSFPFLGVGGPRLDKKLQFSGHAISRQARVGKAPYDEGLERLSDFEARCQSSLAYMRYS